MKEKIKQNYTRARARGGRNAKGRRKIEKSARAADARYNIPQSGGGGRHDILLRDINERPRSNPPIHSP